MSLASRGDHGQDKRRNSVHRVVSACIFLLSSISIFLASSSSAQVALEPEGVALAEPQMTVRWTPGRLSVFAKEASLADILREVSRQTGIKVQGLDRRQEKVSVRFAGLSLLEGLEQLLAHMNYAIVGERSSEGATVPRIVHVFGPRETPSREALSSESSPNARAELISEYDQTNRTVVAFPAPIDLNQALSTGDQETKLNALYTSVRLGKREILRRATDDPDESIRATAFELLNRLDPEQAVDLLLEATRSDQPALRVQALQLLRERSAADETTILSALEKAIADEDITVKGFAIQTLAGWEGPESMRYLRRAFRDPDPNVRLMVVEIVAQKEENRWLLQDALRDNNESVRSIAAFWLKQANSRNK